MLDFFGSEFRWQAQHKVPWFNDRYIWLAAEPTTGWVLIVFRSAFSALQTPHAAFLFSQQENLGIDAAHAPCPRSSDS